MSVAHIDWLTPTVGLTSLYEDRIINGKVSYTGSIGGSSINLYWNSTDYRWDLFNVTSGLVACSGDNENLLAASWSLLNVNGTLNRRPRITSIVSISANKDNTFKLNSGQPLPLSGSPLYCEVNTQALSGFLTENATFVQQLKVSPKYPAPVAKVYAGITWREQ
jgi:hypothetical protein